MDRLDRVQAAIKIWQRKNFPNTSETDLTLGVCEESGELAACVLKMRRGIRSDRYNEARLHDAIGDVVIYLMGICDAHGWALTSVVSATADVVLARTSEDLKAGGERWAGTRTRPPRRPLTQQTRRRTSAK